MPLYRYECFNKKCGKNDKIMEFMVPLAQHDAEIKCPICRRPLHKMLAAPYFTIK